MRARGAGKPAAPLNRLKPTVQAVKPSSAEAAADVASRRYSRLSPSARARSCPVPRDAPARTARVVS